MRDAQSLGGPNSRQSPASSSWRSSPLETPVYRPASSPVAAERNGPMPASGWQRRGGSPRTTRSSGRSVFGETWPRTQLLRDRPMSAAPASGRDGRGPSPPAPGASTCLARGTGELRQQRRGRATVTPLDLMDHAAGHTGSRRKIEQQPAASVAFGSDPSGEPLIEIVPYSEPFASSDRSRRSGDGGPAGVVRVRGCRRRTCCDLNALR